MEHFIVDGIDSKCHGYGVYAIHNRFPTIYWPSNLASLSRQRLWHVRSFSGITEAHFLGELW